MSIASCKFLPVTLLCNPLGQEYNEEDEAASSKCKEGDSEEEISVADVVGFAKAEPFRAPG